MINKKNIKLNGEIKEAYTGKTLPAGTKAFMEDALVDLFLRDIEKCLAAKNYGNAKWLMNELSLPKVFIDKEIAKTKRFYNGR